MVVADRAFSGTELKQGYRARHHGDEAEVHERDDHEDPQHLARIRAARPGATAAGARRSAAGGLVGGEHRKRRAQSLAAVDEAEAAGLGVEPAGHAQQLVGVLAGEWLAEGESRPG